ncbi:MAG: hypothetical protein ABIK28_17790 [Planctomycetota bacterium]
MNHLHDKRGILTSAASVGILAYALFCAGCATSYNELMQSVRTDYYAGNMEGALVRINEQISKVDNEDEKNRPLLLLERSIIHQRMGNFKAAQDDLMRADEKLEVLDFSNDAGGTLLEFTTSDSLTIYRGQPHEKILLNTLNMCNFLAEEDLTAARIEARRAEEMHDYQKQVEEEEQFNYSNGLTMLLYGLVFEASQRPNDAYLALRKAFEMTQAPFLKARLLHTAKAIGHSDRTRWEQEFGPLPPPVPEGYGTALVLVMNGRVPIRVEKEVIVTGSDLNLEKDGVSMSTLGCKTIRYPELVTQSHRYRMGSLSVDNGAGMDLTRAVDIETQAINRFKDELPKIITACVTRFLTRAIISGAASSAIEEGLTSKDGTKPDPSVKAFFDALIFAALSELDVPDVRCWNLLPAEVFAGLVSLPEGDHQVSITMTGSGEFRQSRPVTVKAGSMSMLIFYVTE